MKNIQLQEFLQGRSQTQAAQEVGVNQAAISAMVRKGRNIILSVDPTGRVLDAFEIKRIGRFGK